MSRIIAALSFFTRIPFWRLKALTKEDYERVVPLWPMAGWLTAAVMTFTFWVASLCLPVSVALILAIAARLLVTGALHEDGFADFFDGFGGGSSRESTLRIMKDSHIGTYGVVALILYFLLLFAVLQSYFTSVIQLQPTNCFGLEQPSVFHNFYCSLIFFAADPFAKWASSNIINVLPYARKEEEAKNKLVYNKMTLAEKILGLLIGALPAFIIFSWQIIFPMLAASFAAALVIFLCYKKLHAYTGDCCGACFIISELSFYIVALAVMV